MGLVVVLLRWANLFFAIRAAHKALRQPVLVEIRPRNGRRVPDQRRRQAGRRVHAERSDALRAVVVRFVVWGIFRRAERVLDQVGQWILFYDTAKTLFLFWLLISHDFAASQLFHALIEPVIQPYEPLIDDLVARAVRSIRATNFLILLVFTHATQLLPVNWKAALTTTHARAQRALLWARDAFVSLTARPPHVLAQADDAANDDAEPVPRPDSVSDRSAHRNENLILYSTLPGSWRPLGSPAKAFRPALPQAWSSTPSSIPAPRIQPLASSSRRVVSNGSNAQPSSRTSSRAATVTARALSKLPAAPSDEPLPRVRLMPDWPANQGAASVAGQQANGNAADAGNHAEEAVRAGPLGRPPSPPLALAQAYGLSPRSGLSLKRPRASGSPSASGRSTPNSSQVRTPRKRTRRTTADEEAFEDASVTSTVTKGKGKGKGKADTQPGVKPTRSRRTARADAISLDGTDDDGDDLTRPQPARKRARKGVEAQIGHSADEDEVLTEAGSSDAEPSSASRRYSTRTLRSRARRGMSTTPSVLSASPPPSPATTTNGTTPRAKARTQARPKAGASVSVSRTSSAGTTAANGEGKKSRSSTSSEARRRNAGSGAAAAKGAPAGPGGRAAKAKADADADAARPVRRRGQA